MIDCVFHLLSFTPIKSFIVSQIVSCFCELELGVSFVICRFSGYSLHLTLSSSLFLIYGYICPCLIYIIIIDCCTEMFIDDVPLTKELNDIIHIV